MREDSPVAREDAGVLWFLRCVLCGRRDDRTAWPDPDEADCQVACPGCGASVFALIEGTAG